MLKKRVDLLKKRQKNGQEDSKKKKRVNVEGNGGIIEEKIEKKLEEEPEGLKVEEKKVNRKEKKQEENPEIIAEEKDEEKNGKKEKTEDQLKKLKAKKRDKKKRQKQKKKTEKTEVDIKKEAKNETKEAKWTTVPVQSGSYVIEYDDEDQKNPENEDMDAKTQEETQQSEKKKKTKESQSKDTANSKEEKQMESDVEKEEDNSSSISSEAEEQMPKKTRKEVESFTRISICIPDSILEKSQSRELQTYLVSQIARYACIFRVDEIIVLTDHGYKKRATSSFLPSSYIAKNLDYLETPQYLRRMLFPLSPDLKLVGLMAPLEASHHLKTEDYCMYREGVVLDRPVKSGAKGSWVDVGLYKQVQVDKVLPAKTRVTVKINETYKKGDYFKHLTGTLVSHNEPQDKEGLYWGYTVRIADRFHDIFKECPFKDGYDFQVLIDSSSKTDLESEVKKTSQEPENQKVRHVLLMLSPSHGLQALLEADEHSRSHYQKVVDKFNLVGDIVERVGVKNIWVDEKLFIALKILNEKLRKN